MDLRGLFSCSFTIKGHPYHEDFKVVLETSVSVYDKNGVLQKKTVSKLPSKLIVIEQYLHKGVQLPDVVFEKQRDEYETLSKPVFNGRETVRQMLDAKRQYEAKCRRQPLQTMELKSFEMQFPKQLRNVCNKDKPPLTTLHVQIEMDTEKSENDSIPFNDNPDISQETTFQSLSTNGIKDTMLEMNVGESGGNILDSIAVKTEGEMSEETIEDYQHDQEVIRRSICTDGEENSVCPVGLSYTCSTDIKQEPLDCETPARICESDNIVVTEPFIDHVDSSSNNVQISLSFLDGNRDSFHNLKPIMSGTENNETFETAVATSERTDQLKPCFSDIIQPCFSDIIQSKVDSTGDTNEIRQTYQDCNKLPSVSLDHADKIIKPKTKRNKGYNKVGRPRKNIRNALDRFLDKGNKCVTHESDTSIINASMHKGFANISEQIKQESTLEQSSHLRVDNDDRNSDTPNAKSPENDIGNDANGNNRKRRRCRRNVNYKSLVDSIDFAVSEEERIDSGSESAYEPKENIDKTERPDPDYNPPGESGSSGSEESTDEEELPLLEVDEKNDEEKTKHVEKKTEKGKKSMKIRKSKQVIIPVDLSEHADKFEIVKFVSSEQKNRGKPLEEISHDTYACKICKTYQTEDTRSMSLHLGEHIQGKLRCVVCETECSSASRKCVHMREEHPGQCADDRSMCELCGKTFLQLYCRKQHMFQVHKIPSFECQLCRKRSENNEKFATARELKHHQRESHSHEIHLCKKCDFPLLKKGQYIRHVATCNVTNQSETQKFQCNECIFSCNKKLA